MSRAVTLEDVARAAGVSRATASRVVRGDDCVAPAKVDAVRAAVKELHYVPNTAARTLVTKRTDTIVLVVPEPDDVIFSDPFFATIVRALTKKLQPTPIQLVLAFADQANHKPRIRTFLSDGHVDGAIIVSHHQKPEHEHTFAQLSTPHVFIGRPSPAIGEASWVDVDNIDGGYQAARRLAEAGVQKPAIVTGPLDMVAALDRLQGFTRFCQTHDLPFVTIEGAFTDQSGRLAARQLVPMIKDGAIDGVFFSSDLMALAGMEEFERSGLTIPKDCPLVSFDNIQQAQNHHPPLSTFNNPASALAETALAILLKHINEHKEHQTILLPCTEVPGGTC